MEEAISMREDTSSIPTRNELSIKILGAYTRNVGLGSIGILCSLASRGDVIDIKSNKGRTRSTLSLRR